MNSLLNSEPTPLKPLEEYETKIFERFDMTFRVNLFNSSVEEWESYVIEGDGTSPPIQDWRKTGKMLHTSEVRHVLFQDKERCKLNHYIFLYATPDGPIMGIELETRDDCLILLDPCAVIFDGKSRLNLLPIFGVTRELALQKTAIRSRLPPTEMLVAAYPGFLIQNRMYKYQLRPKLPFVTTPELVNDAT